MAARTDKGAITGNPVLDIGGASSIVFTAVDIDAGDLVIVGGRYEGGVGDPLNGISDTASAANWQYFYFSDNPQVWIAVCHDHPGGTGVVITATTSGNRGYRESYGRIWSGSVGESDPVRVSGTAEITSTDGSGGTFTLTRTTGGAGMLIGILASYGSLASPVTTNGTQLGTRATPTSYGALVYKTHSGAGSESLTGSGGNGLSNGIALEIQETGGGGGGSSIAPIAAQHQFMMMGH